MENKKTNKITIEVPSSATKDEVWAAFCKAKAQKSKALSEDGFLAVMSRVNTYVRLDYVGVMDDLWRGIYRSAKLNCQLTYQRGCKRGSVHYYNMLTILSLLKKESIFKQTVSLRMLAEALVTNQQEAECCYRGRSAYELQDEKVVRQILRTLKP